MKKFLISKLPIYILIFGTIVTLILLTHPLGFDNYGYDYGFYSYAVQHTPLDSPAYFAGQVSDYGNHLFVILNWLRLPQIPTLNLLFVLFFGLSGILLYESIKKFGKLESIFGLILFIFSITQSQLFTMYLWKAVYGQVLILAIFLIISESKKLPWELIPLGILFITHKTSSIIAIASITPYYLFSEVKNKRLLIPIVIASAAIFFFLLNGFSYSKQLLNSDVQNGLFLNIWQYLKYSWYLIPLASLGVYKNIKSKTNLQWLGLLLISSVFIIFKITFYQRLILYLDLGLIYFSVVSIYELKNNRKQQLIFITITSILALSNFFLFTKDYTQPLLTDSEITEIRSFSNNNQGSFVLSLSAADGPWLMANLGGDIRLAAPGLFEDKHSKSSWQNFWSNPKNPEFLNTYPKPLFIYEKSTIFYLDQNINTWECLLKTSPHFYKYICEK